ncbi:MAG: hypothetical protein V4567_01615, partial [Pseudomonadota bacterium]
RIFRPWMDEKRSTGVAFLWATFLWPRKERWPARPGGGRKKDRDVIQHTQEREDLRNQRTHARYENQPGRSGQCAYARVHVDPSGGGSLRLDRFRRV